MQLLPLPTKHGLRCLAFSNLNVLDTSQLQLSNNPSLFSIFVLLDFLLDALS